MYHACIKNGKVVNVIVADQAFIDAGHIADQYDAFIDITDMSPQPGVNWDYDGSAFHDNRYVAPTLDTIINTSLDTSSVFGLTLIRQFERENVKMGISIPVGDETIPSAVKRVADYLHWLGHYLERGNMNAAMSQISLLLANPDDQKATVVPYVTDARLNTYLGYIKTYMGIP